METYQDLERAAAQQKRYQIIYMTDASHRATLISQHKQAVYYICDDLFIIKRQVQP